MSPSTPDGIKAMNTTPYSEAIGCLTHAAVCTHPEITFAVGQAARFCQNPGKVHWSAVKRILSYLAGTKTHGLLFSGTGHTTIVGYTDSDYAGNKDTRHSTSGFIFSPSAAPYRGAVPNNHAPLFPPRRLNTLLHNASINAVILSSCA